MHHRFPVGSHVLAFGLGFHSAVGASDGHRCWFYHTPVSIYIQVLGTWCYLDLCKIDTSSCILFPFYICFATICYRTFPVTSLRLILMSSACTHIHTHMCKCGGGLEYRHRRSLRVLRGDRMESQYLGVQLGQSWMRHHSKVWLWVVNGLDQRFTAVQSTDPLSRQRGCSTLESRHFDTKRRKENILPWAPKEGPAPRQTARLTVSRNLTSPHDACYPAIEVSCS
jgi:hypothetical protein